MIPRKQIVDGHVAPFTAFSDAYFAEHNVAVWVASRGFGGKSFLLALLALTEQITLGASVNILGGSGEQSQRVHAYLSGSDPTVAGKFWDAPSAPRHLLVGDPTKTETRTSNGGIVRALMASVRSVRGPHPSRLRADEVDDFDIVIFDAAMGQTMGTDNVKAQTVCSGTHHNPNGTMTEILRRADERGWPVYRWCLPPDGKIVDGDGCLVAIEDVSVGDYVLSGTGVRRKVTQTWSREYDGKLVEIDVTGLPDLIRMTPEHRVMTSKGWTSAGNLVAGDRVLDPMLPLKPGGDYLTGWVIGMYLADGNKTGSGNGIQISSNEDQVDSVSERLYEWVKAHPFHGKRPGPKTDGKPKIYNGNGRGENILIHHPPLKNLVNEWVLGKNSLTKKLVRVDIQKELARGILDGWIEGDGWKIMHYRMGQSSSVDLAWQMFRLASSLGLSTAMHNISARITPGIMNDKEIECKPAWRVSTCEFRTRWRTANIPKVEEVRRINANEPGLSLRELGRRVDAKHESVKRWLDVANSRHGKQAKTIGMNLARRVRSVKEVSYSGPVLDLTVDKDHTFLAGGMAVSNSYEETVQPHGWLPPSEVERKRGEVTKLMFDVEYELFQPSIEGRAIDTEAVEALFDKSLGEYDGAADERIIIARPPGDFYHGTDWAKARDWTIMHTGERHKGGPDTLAAWLRTGRKPWPAMIAQYDERAKRYGGPAYHDITGIGDVVDDYLEYDSVGFSFAGRNKRDAMISKYVVAIENGEMVYPRIRHAYDEHRYATVADLYSGQVGHLPDSIAAAALAWLARPEVGQSYEDYLKEQERLAAKTKDGDDWEKRLEGLGRVRM